MSAGPVVTATVHRDDVNVACWCCDNVGPPDRMVRLGNHPEVHLCLQCAHYVHQQAWVIEDERREGPAAFVRDRFRRLRTAVTRRGWHQNRYIGGRLRWLGRYLP